jgi:hypothetical protein
MLKKTSRDDWVNISVARAVERNSLRFSSKRFPQSERLNSQYFPTSLHSIRRLESTLSPWHLSCCNSIIGAFHPQVLGHRNSKSSLRPFLTWFSHKRLFPWIGRFPLNASNRPACLISPESKVPFPRKSTIRFIRFDL